MMIERKKRLMMQGQEQNINLLDVSKPYIYYISTGNVPSNNVTISNNVATITGAAIIAWHLPLVGGNTYVYSLATTYTGGSRLRMRVHYSDTEITNLRLAPTTEEQNVSSGTQTYIFTVPVGTNYVYVGFYADPRIAGITISDMTVTLQK